MLSFDGNNDYIDLGKFDTTGNEITITAWIKVDAQTNDPRIISKANGISEGDHTWMLSLYNPPDAPNDLYLRFRLKINGLLN